VRRDLTKADAKALAETLRRDLFRPLVRFNLGDGPNLPWMKFDLSEPEDLEKSSKVYATLIKDCGLPVSRKHVYEKFGIPEPEEGEEILTPPGIAPAVPEAGAALKALKTPLPLPSRTRAQAEVDALADRAREQAAAAMEKLLAPLRELIESGASLEEIRDRLPEIYPDMDTSELEELVARAMFVADLFGRWAADGA
jgi:phage gp29-like protein